MNLIKKRRQFTTWIRTSPAMRSIMHPSMGLMKIMAIHALLHHAVDFPHGPYQVHIWKSYLHREDLPLANVALRVWYCVCGAKGHQGLSHSQLPSGPAIEQSRIIRIPLLRWGCFGNKALPINVEHDVGSFISMKLSIALEMKWEQF